MVGVATNSDLAQVTEAHDIYTFSLAPGAFVQLDLDFDFAESALYMRVVDSSG